MKMLKKSALGIVLSMAMMTSSQAKTTLTCLTGPDTRALVTLMLDRGSERMVKECTLYPIAQGTPFLSANKEAVGARFDGLKDDALNVLMAKIYPGAEKGSSVARNLVLTIIDELVANSFGDFSKQDSCANADILASGLATLEDAQIITALTVMAQQILARNDKTIPLPLCEAP